MRWIWKTGKVIFDVICTWFFDEVAILYGRKMRVQVDQESKVYIWFFCNININTKCPHIHFDSFWCQSQDYRHSTPLKFNVLHLKISPEWDSKLGKPIIFIIFRFQPFNFGGGLKPAFRGTTFHHLSAAWRLASSSWMGEGCGCDIICNLSNGGTFMNYTQECKDAMILACEKMVFFAFYTRCRWGRFCLPFCWYRFWYQSFHQSAYATNQSWLILLKWHRTSHAKTTCVINLANDIGELTWMSNGSNGKTLVGLVI